MATRYKTGEKCSIKGNYVWVEYVDPPKYSPLPTADEKEIPLEVGDTFPPVKSCNRACYRERK